MHFQKSKYPFFWLLIPFLLGILTAHQYPYVEVYCKIGFCVLIVIFLYILFRIFGAKVSLLYASAIAGLVIQILFFLFGMWVWYFQRDEFRDDYFMRYKARTYMGRIVSEPQLKKGFYDFDLAVFKLQQNGKWYQASGKVKQRVYFEQGAKLPLYYGTVLQINDAQLRDISAASNPYVFDYRQFMYHKGVLSQINSQESQVQVLAQDEGAFLIRKALWCRAQCVEIFRKRINDKNALGVANALILGTKTDLEDELQQDFRNTGTIHVLVISGMHVAYIYLFLMVFLKHLPARLKWLKVLVVILLLFAYSLFTGFTPSVIRAFVMISVYTIAKEIDRSSHRYQVWALSAFVMLVFCPDWLFQLGFLLSFLAVLGILFAYRPLSKFFINGWVPLWFTESVAVCLSAQIFVMPMIIYFFHTFPLNFIISNLWVQLPLMLLMVVGPLILLLPFPVLVLAFEYLVRCMLWGLHRLANLSFLMLRDVYLHSFEWLLLSLLLLFFVMLFKYRNKYYLAVFLVLLAVLSFSIQKRKYRSDSQHLMMVYHLPNNYAIAFIQGKTAYVLSDLHAQHPVFNQQVMPFLKAKNVNILHVDTLGTQFSYLNLRSRGDTIFFHKEKYLLFRKQSLGLATVSADFTGVFWHRYPRYRSFPAIIKSPLVFVLGGNDKYQSKYYADYLLKNRIKFLDMRKNNAYLSFIFPE